jgi:hypothetical protein
MDFELETCVDSSICNTFDTNKLKLLDNGINSVDCQDCIIHVQDSPSEGDVISDVALNELDQCHIPLCAAQGVNNQLLASHVDSLQGHSIGPFDTNVITHEKPKEFQFSNTKNFMDCDAYVNNIAFFSVYNDDIVEINPFPLSSINDADVVVHNFDNRVSPRDVHSSLDSTLHNDICDYNDDEFNFTYLNHLFSCSIINCKFCTYIRSSFISFIHFNIGVIPLGPFISGNFISLNSGEGGSFINSNISSYIQIQQKYTGIPNFL